MAQPVLYMIVQIIHKTLSTRTYLYKTLSVVLLHNGYALQLMFSIIVSIKKIT